MVYIYDDFLTKDEIQYLKKLDKNRVIWYELNKNVGNEDILSNILRRIWRKYPDFEKIEEKVVGIEIWKTEGATLDTHVDRDEAWYSQFQEYKFPLYGSVLYLHDEIPKKGGELCMKLPRGEVQIMAKPNRLIIFDSGRTPHYINKTESYRLSFVTNLWDYELKKDYFILPKELRKDNIIIND